MAPDPAALLAQAKAAAGGEAWNALQTMVWKTRIETGGMSGSAESWEDLLAARWVDRFELGPMKGAEGFDSERPWSQDSSGQSHFEEGGDEREGAANETYRRTLSFWFPDRRPGTVESAGERAEGERRFHVLRVTPSGGRPYELWLDASTFLIDRTVEKTALETRTTFFSDYREVEGAKIAFASRSTNGNEAYDLHFQVESVEFNRPLAREFFELPAPPQADFALAASKTSTAIPFELLNNHIYLDVRLNERGPFRFLFDTGGMNIVTPELARELGLKTEGTLEGKGVGEKSEDVALTTVERLEVGEASFRNQVFAVFPLASLAAAEGVPASGIVGYEVAKRLITRVDYERSLLTLTLPAAFAYSGSGISVPFQFNNHIPQVAGEIDGIPGFFDLDTGSRSTLDLLRPFVEKHGLIERYGAQIEGVTGWGVGGPARSLLARGERLKLGTVEFARPVVELSQQQRGAFTDPYVAGNVGGALLKRFNLILDYGHQVVIFEPRATPPVDEGFDRSGLWLNTAGDALEVIDVVAGGPAAVAGLAPGDRIVEVDGRPVRELRLADLRTRFRSEPAGTEVRLKIQRGEEAVAFRITLRDLI